MTLLIKSATLIDPGQPALHGKKRDILVEKGQIKSIGRGLTPGRGTRLIKGKNLHVSPGWLDTGVSFGEPGYEERETIAHGLEVAAGAGFSGIVLNTNTNPTPDTSGDIVFLKEASRGSTSELFPMGTVSVQAKGADLSEMYDMHGAGAVGFSDYKTPIQNPNLLKLALLYSQNFDGLIHSFPLQEELAPHGQMHEGTVSVRLGLRGIPGLAEELRVGRDLALLEYTGGKLHIPTISMAASVRQIEAAKKKGLDVTCSVAIHHLWHTDASLEAFESSFKVMPPLRDSENQKVLRKALKEGVIDFVTSDHCPLDVEQKRREFDQAAFGATGLEETFGIMNQIYGPHLSAEILGRGRKRFGLETAGLEEGQRAVLTLFDPDAEYVLSERDLKSHSKNSMFLGIPMKGKAVGVIVGEKSNL